MKIKRHLSKSLLLICLMLFIVACGQLESERGQPNYRVGTEGINFEFTSFPEYNIQENDQFDVEIEMHNNGAYNSRNVVAFFDANPPNSVIFTEGENKFKNQVRYVIGFKGRSEEIPLGDVKTLDIFQLQASDLGEYYGNQRGATLSAEICYDYATLAMPNVCIGRKSKNSLDCNLDENNEIRFDYPEGQGAPIVISTVVQKIRNESGNIIPYFLLTVDNFGEGETFVNKEVVVPNVVERTSDYYARFLDYYENYLTFNMMEVVELNEEVKSSYIVDGGPLHLVPTNLSGTNAGSCMNANMREDGAVLLKLQLSEYDDSKFRCKNLMNSESNNKMFKLKEGHATVVCDLCTAIQDNKCIGIDKDKTAFYSPLIIQLFYNYKLTLAESVTIVGDEFEEENE